MRTLLVLAALAVAAPALAGRKQDLKLLQRLEKVDGAGSGLDADTVHGLTPEQMSGTPLLNEMAHRLDALEARVNGLSPLPGGALTRDSVYARANRTLQTQGQEQFVVASCNAPRDVAISCAGGVFDGNPGYPIIWMGVVLGDGSTTPDRCMVVVGPEQPPPNLEATVRCIAVP
ncbi:MAG TPA: hypothetical protein VFD84_02850 [Candidatus Binatia bacterium]|jgi:hypothetical protein|nr:hypothetical protein [Candidatus Binatia bacterium]